MDHYRDGTSDSFAGLSLWANSDADSDADAQHPSNYRGKSGHDSDRNRHCANTSDHCSGKDCHHSDTDIYGSITHVYTCSAIANARIRSTHSDSRFDRHPWASIYTYSNAYTPTSTKRSFMSFLRL